MCLLNNKPVAQFKMLLVEDYDDSRVYFIAFELSYSAVPCRRCFIHTGSILSAAAAKVLMKFVSCRKLICCPSYRAIVSMYDVVSLQCYYTSLHHGAQ